MNAKELYDLAKKVKDNANKIVIDEAIKDIYDALEPAAKLGQFDETLKLKDYVNESQLIEIKDYLIKDGFEVLTDSNDIRRIQISWELNK